MNNKLNHSLAIYICAFICWLVPSIIWASVEVDGIYYDLNTTAKTAAVASNPNYYTGAIEIPSSFVYNGSTYNVKSISSCAFLNCSELISITFPNSVTTIGSSAFERCTGLTDVVIGDGVTFIDYEAFKNCSSLSSLTLPSSLKTIENETFSGCTSLSEIIAKRTTPPTIVNTTFDGVDKTACIVYVPEGCKSSYANATNWKAFSNIIELTIVATGSCGDNVTYTIYSDMTMVISGIGEMYDLDGYDVLMYNGYNVSVKRIIIEEGVTHIGETSFNQFTSLISVSIPSSVVCIYPYVFDECPNLSFISVSSNNPKYDSRDKCNGIIETISNKLIIGCKNTVIPNSVASIGRGAFSGCTGLTSVSIPNSVISIGDYAFYGCSGLTTVSIPGSVKEINCRAFSGCVSLASVKIPSGVISIGYDAFKGCTSLSSITIPRSVTSIGRCVFSSCTSLHTIIVDSGNTTYDSRNSCNAIIETSTNTLISGCKNTVIPNTVNFIGNSAFEFCTGLASLSIPGSVKSIGNSAFSSCSGLASLTIPSSVAAIGDSAFIWCKGLISVTLSRGIAFIGGYAFNNCSGLTSVSIPSSVSSIGDRAFTACIGLNSISIDDENTKYDSRDNCNAIIETTSNTLLFGCKNTIIPDNVTSIESWAFSDCKGLTSITIPSGVASIGYFAFSWCTDLSSITVKSEIPATVYNYAFDGINTSTCILYIPMNSKWAYNNAKGWSTFKNIVEYEPDTDISALDNAIYVEQTEGRIGGTTDIPVKLKNSLGVRGFQFAMELPEGAIINSWALSTNRLPSGATLNDKIATQKIEGNKITVACSLNYGDATFTGNDGEIATVNVTFGDDMEVGTYPIYLAACDVTTASGVDEDLSDVKATLVLEDYVVGDANGDGKVRIGDATTILNYIVGAPSDNFKEKAADANGDGKIRIGDATTILNIIVNQ